MVTNWKLFSSERDVKNFMVSSIFKLVHRFPFLIFGHYKCPKMKSRKKSLKKRYKRYLKNTLFFNNNTLCNIFNNFIFFF